MANSGWVKTRKKMNSQQISAIIDEMNASLFKGNLLIKYQQSTKENPSYGPHTWLLSYRSEGQVWANRVCWLETDRQFIMSHGGGGGNFAWWIDGAILNEIAIKFNGTIGDEGISEKWKGVPNRFDDFQNFLKNIMFGHASSDLKLKLIEWEQEIIPPEFRIKSKHDK